MKKNVASWDRIVRCLGAVAMAACALAVPMPPALRGVLAVNAIYLAATALAGTCLGYRLMGISTCPTS